MTRPAPRHVDTLGQESELLARSCGYTTAGQIELDGVVIQVEPDRGNSAAAIVTSA